MKAPSLPRPRKNSHGHNDLLYLTKYCLTVLKLREPEEIAKRILSAQWMRKGNATSTGGLKVLLKKVVDCLPKILAEVQTENGAAMVFEPPAGFQYNIITHGLWYNGAPLDNKTLHEVWYKWNQEAGTKGRLSFDNFHRNLLATAPRWNPWEQLFTKKWSGKDQIKKLESFLSVSKGFGLHLKKHIIRAINQIFGSNGSRFINRYVFVFRGGTHIGKSYLLSKLTLKDEVPGFSSETDLSQKEIHCRMCQVPNLINEEIDNVSSSELRDLKQIISYSGGLIRLPYDKAPTDMRRVATLWGSVNHAEFLNEVADRWIVFEVKHIDFEYAKKVDFIDLWRQCYAEWEKNPLAGELTKEELTQISRRAETHRIVPPLEQYLLSQYTGDPASQKPLSLSDVREHVRYEYPSVSDIKLSRTLEKCFGQFKIGRAMLKGKRGTFYAIKQGK